MELFETKEYAKLADVEASIEACMEAWEKIVAKNNQVTGGMGFKSQLEQYKTFAQMLADYNEIKATLSILMFKVDNDYIERLRKKGYKIATSKGDTVEERTANYVESIIAAQHRSDNLITKIKMKQNELLEENKGRESVNIGFEELIASLSMALGFEVNDNVTLARYNEFTKLIKKRNKEASAHNK